MSKPAAKNTIRKLNTKWTVVDGYVHVYMFVEGRDADGVKWGLKNWEGFGYDAEQITADDVQTEVAPETLLVKVMDNDFDRFIESVVRMMRSGDDVQIYTSAKQALLVSVGEKDYERLPQAKALGDLEAIQGMCDWDQLG